MTTAGVVALLVVGMAIAFALVSLVAASREKKRPPPEPIDQAPASGPASPPAESSPPDPSPASPPSARERPPGGNDAIDEAIGGGCGSAAAIAAVAVALVFGLCTVSLSR